MQLRYICVVSKFEIYEVPSINFAFLLLPLLQEDKWATEDKQQMEKDVSSYAFKKIVNSFAT